MSLRVLRSTIYQLYPSQIGLSLGINSGYDLLLLKENKRADPEEAAPESTISVGRRIRVQVTLNRETDEAGDAVDLEFSHDICTISVHCFWADFQ